MHFKPDIHHRRTIRLMNYDYTREGAYFVTMCVWQRECLFGDIIDGAMHLNDFGRVVESQWRGLPAHFSGINLDEFVIMSNHFHGIVAIVGARFIAPDLDLEQKQGAMNRAPTVGEIIRGFKARCTHAVNICRNTPGLPLWQRNYFERIIRDEGELTIAREYIDKNPLKWELDKENPALAHL